MSKNIPSSIHISEAVFHNLLTTMETRVYVSDCETEELYYVSDALKSDFGITDYAGKKCWEVMALNQTARCDKCLVSHLKDKAYISQTEQTNAINGHRYCCYDSLIDWHNGRRAHFHMCLDITETQEEFKAKNLDELTGLYNRRSGKEKLRHMVERAHKEGVKMTVCMYDMNDLKFINDTYGHKMGDFALKELSDATIACIRKEDVAFRMSGDEFVVAFYGCDEVSAGQCMKRIMERLRERDIPGRYRYQSMFCYGLMEIDPDSGISADEALASADEKMYYQKQQRHIRLARKRAEFSDKELRKEIESFDYDKEHLYEALTESTNDFIYIGNMKTGTFRYSNAMVEEFELPGNIIPNAASVWAAYVHPEDRQEFLEANQEVADGTATRHIVKYRAKNKEGKWIWLQCRGHVIYDKDGTPDLFAGFITRVRM